MTASERAEGSAPLPSHLDPAKAQVIFVDLQPELLSGSGTTDPEQVARASEGLAQLARRLGMPMLFSLAPQGDKEARLIDGLQDFAAPEQVLSRHPAGALLDRATRARLAPPAERPVLIVSGFAAEAVVHMTVLDGLAAGYEVYYPVDAIGGLTERSEAAVFRAMDQAGAHPTSVVSLAARLAPDFSRAPGTEARGIIADLTE